MPVFVCKIDETQQGVPEEASTALMISGMQTGIRTLLLASYDWGAVVYSTEGWSKIVRGSAVQRMRDAGCLFYYGHTEPHTGRKKRIPVDVDVMVKKWHTMILGLATAHDKDGVDHYEAGVDECLRPMLTAPVKQLREFAPKLLESLKDDPAVPFLVWRAYEIWIEQIKGAPDEDVKELKTDLAREIVDLVAGDVGRQLPEAMVHALQWRSPEGLKRVKEVVEVEKAAGRPARLKGRESCLFLEVGGTVDEPQVRIQI